MAIKRILRFIIAFVLLLLIVINLGWVLRPPDTNSPVSAVKAFHSVDNEQFDVLFFGCSHAQYAFAPFTLYDEYGIVSYNYGTAWQSFNDTLLWLQDALRTQNPKAVVIETANVIDFQIDVDLNGHIYPTRVMDNFQGKRDYLKQCFGDRIDRYISYYFPIMVFHGNWECIEPESFTYGYWYEMFTDNLGYVFSGESDFESTLVEGTTAEQKELTGLAIECLDKMVALCEEKGVKIIFCYTPTLRDYYFNDAVRQYAQEHNCDYINIQEHLTEADLLGTDNMVDSVHLSDVGAERLSRYFGSLLIDKYGIHDRRGEPDNICARVFAGRTCLINKEYK